MRKTNPILRVISKTLFAPIILYGLYVQFHGDFGPGGGFQAGVIIAAAFILYGMVFSLEELKQLRSAKNCSYINGHGCFDLYWCWCCDISLGGPVFKL